MWVLVFKFFVFLSALSYVFASVLDPRGWLGEKEGVWMESEDSEGGILD